MTLTALADAGWTFSGWSGDADCADSHVTMTRDLTCAAVFTQIPRPDLTGQFTSLTKTIYRGQERVNFGLTVVNRGNQPAIGRFSVAFYLSTDGVLDSADTLLMTKSVRTRSLAPSMGTNLSGQITLPLPSEGRYIVAVIDSSNLVIESDEGNNRVAASIPAASGRRTSKGTTLFTLIGHEVAGFLQIPGSRFYGLNFESGAR